MSPLLKAIHGVILYYCETFRNSIEAWSKLPGHIIIYNKIASLLGADKAFGNNLLLKGNKYCLYSGDVNQDGFINLTDVILTHTPMHIICVWRLLK